jgi:ketosteroid isomerase-like protein
VDDDMTMQAEPSGVEHRGECERLSRRFAELFDGRDDGADVLADDLFCDLNMPTWRFQLQGREAWARQMRTLARGPLRIDVVRTVPTDHGFVAEHEEHQHVDGEDLTARRLWLCETRGGRIVEAVCFCTGEWDAELRSRHAVEAPMLRPWQWGPP